MDDRQQQVKIGAGLEESRINEDFKDFIFKWGPRVLMVVLVLVLGYQGLQLLEQRQKNSANEAFLDYLDMASVGSAASLIEAGDKHANVGSIRELAYLNAGIIMLTEGTRGVSYQAINMFAPTEDETLSEEERTQRYTRALEVFKDVEKFVEGDPDKKLMLIQAYSGQATAHMSLGNNDEAKAMLERVVEMGEANGFNDVAAFARQRLANFDEVLGAPEIVAKADLPENSTLAVPGDFNFPENAQDRIRATDKPDPLETQEDRLSGEPNVTPITIDDDEEEPADPKPSEPEVDPSPGG